MFSYYPRYPRSSYWQDEFDYLPSRTRYTRTAESRHSPQHPATSIPRPTQDSRPTRVAASNPTVFKTYNPEAYADFTSRKITTLVGPEPRYIDDFVIYCLESVENPRVQVVKGMYVEVFSAGKLILKFCLPQSISAIDIDVSLMENNLTIRVPHCLSATQECQVIDISDGLLGDEYDEYGHYESLCAEMDRKEKAKRLEMQKQKEEEEKRRQYKMLLEKQMMDEKRRDAEEKANRQRRYNKHDSFEPMGYFSSFFNRPNFSRLFSV